MGCMEETLQQIAGQAQGIGTAFLAVFTLANCFFGYKLRRVWITVAGFLIGLAAGFAAACRRDSCCSPCLG